MLLEAVESVKNQTHHDWELIIVDDASSDDTSVVLSQLPPDPKIRMLRNAEVQGLAKRLPDDSEPVSRDQERLEVPSES